MDLRTSAAELTSSAARISRAEELFTAMREALSSKDRERCLAEIVSLTIDLADRAAHAYRTTSLDIEDLLQVARLGLVKAIRGYDPSWGRGFTAYALPTISGELKRYFRDHGWLVRPPRFLQELRARLGVEEQMLRNQLRRDPTVEELAERLGVPPKVVDEARLAARGFTAEPITNDGDRRPIDPPSAGDDFQVVADRDAVRRALPVLSHREQCILRLRYFDDLTQAEIGARVGLSQMQVSRVLTSSLGRLRTVASAAQASVRR